MITTSLNTWKTELTLSVRAKESARLKARLHDLLIAEVSQLDAMASRFRADSDLSRVNASAGSWVEVPWDFVTVLTASLDAARMTRGVVDPTMGAAIKAAGYDKWAGQESPVAARVHTGRWRGVGIRPGRREAQVRIPEGTALDLGSVAKGWLADRLADRVARSGYEVCTNMGGDIRVIATDPWTVWADPEIPHLSAIPIDLTNAAIATSGTSHRRWSGGHHLIDPRTGTPACTPWSSVSVVAGCAAHANAAATAGMILGAEGPKWMAAAGLDARFSSHTSVVTTGRWSQEVAA